MASDSDFEPWAILACNLETISDYYPGAPVLWTVERMDHLAVVKRLGPIDRRAAVAPGTPPDPPAFS
jgi:hypothetical protein